MSSNSPTVIIPSNAFLEHVGESLANEVCVVYLKSESFVHSGVEGRTKRYLSGSSGPADFIQFIRDSISHANASTLYLHDAGNFVKGGAVMPYITYATK